MLSTLTLVIAQAPPAAPRRLLDLGPLNALGLDLVSLLIIAGVVLALWAGIKSKKPAVLISLLICVFLAGYVLRQATDITKLRDSDTFDVVDDMTGIDGQPAPPPTR